MQNEMLKNPESDPSMRRLHEACQRISELPHIKSSAGVLLTREVESGEKEYLVVYNEDKNSFGNPAGHVHAGETLLEAVEREVQEEANITPEQYRLTGISQAMLISDPETPSLLVVYSGEITEALPHKQEIDDEDVTFAYLMTPDEIRKKTRNYEENEGSTVLRVEIDMPSRSPEELLGDLMKYFDECGIDDSVLS